MACAGAAVAASMSAAADQLLPAGPAAFHQGQEAAAAAVAPALKRLLVAATVLVEVMEGLLVFALYTG